MAVRPPGSAPTVPTHQRLYAGVRGRTLALITRVSLSLRQRARVAIRRDCTSGAACEQAQHLRDLIDVCESCARRSTRRGRVSPSADAQRAHHRRAPLTERPELFAAVIDGVGCQIRYATSPSRTATRRTRMGRISEPRLSPLKGSTATRR